MFQITKKEDEPQLTSPVSQNIKTIIPSTDHPFTIQLNQEGTAYITVDYLSQELCDLGLQTFGKLWSLHPEQKHRIIFQKKQLPVYRYSKCYLKTPTDLSHTNGGSYMYSGYNTEHNNDDLPQEFMPFYEAILKKDPKYNQVVANWYQDQNDFIAAHSDCQRGMIENAAVCLISLYGTENSDLYRYLEVTPKNRINSLSERFIIRLDHGSIITMHGRTQDEFKHEIKRAEKTVAPRLSLSFRQMK